VLSKIKLKKIIYMKCNKMKILTVSINQSPIQDITLLILIHIHKK